MQWIEGEVSDDGHIPSAMADAQPGLILVELHVQDPVELVFDGPMGSHSLGELRRIEHRRGDIQASLGRCLAALLDRRFDHANGGEAGEAGLSRIAAVAGHPVHGVGHDMVAGLDAAMALVVESEALDLVRGGRRRSSSASLHAGSAGFP